MSLHGGKQNKKSADINPCACFTFQLLKNSMKNMSGHGEAIAPPLPAVPDRRGITGGHRSCNGPGWHKTKIIIYNINDNVFQDCRI